MSKPYEQGRPRFIRVLHAYVGVPRDVKKGDVVAYLGPVEVPDVETADVEKTRLIPRITPLDPSPAIAGTPFSVELTLADLDAMPVGQDILDKAGQRWTKEGPGLWRDHTYPRPSPTGRGYPPFPMDEDNALLYFRYRPFTRPFSVEAAMADEEGRALVQAILDRKAGTQ